jgi:transcriptional regulator with XRE-family HTH domain
MLDPKQNVEVLMGQYGRTEAQIAVACDVSPATINRIRRGATMPRYDLAVALDELRQYHARKQVETAS